MTDSQPRSDITEADLAELTGLHKFYFDLLVKGAGFAATAQATIVAIGGGKITDPRQVQMVATGVGIIACLACVMFLMAVPKLIELDRWVEDAARALLKPWRPHAEMLPKLALVGGGLNFASLLAAVFALWNPVVFVVAS